ncbi:uncharacterized protein LOC106169284 [Lingula anatina]|uniref:Uncharacterized protein LOC106169284 n=1 Tax=Lingula anatina TaxID=7574 RepID=A0A1S3J1L1_LINAN|nr:uncharacterized protein LOC106169284 [Lingula anatina]|eukprot:XP_013404148.1 uncharacterized protein LOC106169284 [Lingula anatina]
MEKDVTKTPGVMVKYPIGKAPEGAILLSDKQRLALFYKKISESNGIELWPYKYGPLGLSVAVLASASGINNLMRRFHMLGRKNGLFPAAFTVVAAPAIACAVFQSYWVAEYMIMSDEPCSTCFMMRSSLIQLTTGVAYPVVGGSLTNMCLAYFYQTRGVPPLTQPKSVMNFLWTGYKPYTGLLTGMVAVNLGLALFVTYSQLASRGVLYKGLVMRATEEL